MQLSIGYVYMRVAVTCDSWRRGRTVSNANGRRPEPAMVSPTVRQRRLARLLRWYREPAGLTLEDVSTRLGWSRAKVSRIESARIHVNPDDVADLADLYGLPGVSRDELLTLARQAKQRGWYSVYADMFRDDYIGLEAEAALIRTWETQLVPGLLQCDGYIRALAGTAPDASPGDVERHVQVRRTRQVLLTREHAPELRVVLDEGVFARPVGGADVMREQARVLLDWAARPNVTLRVLPYSAGAHQAMDGSFSLLSFDHPADPDVGYVEGVHGAVYLENAADLNRCNLMFERLSGLALTPDQTAEFLAARAKE